MIPELLGDLKKMSIVGVFLFFIGFILSTAFVIFLGVSTAFTGLSLFGIVKKTYENEKKNIK